MLFIGVKPLFGAEIGFASVNLKSPAIYEVKDFLG
jgi:hypothetical protein